MLFLKSSQSMHQVKLIDIHCLNQIFQEIHLNQIMLHQEMKLKRNYVKYGKIFFKLNKLVSMTTSLNLEETLFSVSKFHQEQHKKVFQSQFDKSSISQQLVNYQKKLM